MIKKFVSILLGLVLFAVIFDIFLILITYIDLFPLQTRGTEWYKLSNDELIDKLIGDVIIFCIIVIYFKYVEPRIPEKEQENKKTTFSICPTCKETFHYNELKNGKCKYCEDVDTVDIEEYYKNNPDKKE